MSNNANIASEFPKTTLKFILYFAKKQWLKFSIPVLASVMWATCDAIFPYFLKRIVNILTDYQGEMSGIFSAVQTPLLLLILFFIISEIFIRAQGFVQVYKFPRFRADIREALFSYVKLHSHEYFSSHFSGNIAKKISDLPVSAENIMEMLTFQFVTASVGAVLVFFFMWEVQPVFAIILLIWLCIHLTISGLFVKFGNKLWKAHSDAVSGLSGKIVDVFANMQNVRLFARRKYELNYLKDCQTDEMQKSRRAILWTEVLRLGLGVNGLFLIFAMLFTLLYGWSHHWVTLGDFTQVGMQSFWLLGWAWHISFQMMMLTKELGISSAALSLVTQPHAVVDSENAKTLKVEKGEIVFENVYFEYQNNRPVFDGLNIRIAPGEKIGLVGFSGSGKSSFVNLILRFYDIQSGRILIDGQEIAGVTQDSLRTQIAMIPQDPVLFHRDLMENIRYGCLDATTEEVIEASKLAHCHEFIAQLDEGYDGLVGERGIKLSGGQRQRIAIARAILKNAPILILDEATSSLDSVTEKLIHESLTHLMKGKTTIVVAHRLSTLSDMDRILVFDQGRVVEEGSKESLLSQNGHFAKLWNMQMNGFLPDER
jgi:ATP-binding cassette subfamily B protein